MTVRALQGQSAVLDATVLGADGAAANATAGTVTIRDSLNNVVLFTPFGSLTHVGTGQYRATWAVGGTQALGIYRATWSGFVVAGDTLGDKYEDIAVFSPGVVVVAPSSGLETRGIYITPTKLRNSALGTVLGNRTDAQLLSLIRIASGLANRACTAPRVYDFRGGSVVNEQHQWDVGNDHVAGSRRVYPYYPPVKTISRFQIRVTQGGAGVVNFPSEQIYLNKQEGYVELVSLSLTTASVYAAGLIPNIGLATPVAELDYEYGSTFIVTDERLSTVSGDKLYLAESQFWTNDAPIVKVAGLVVNSGYSYDPYEGTILFTSPVTDEVTASYAHRLHPDIAEATSLIAADVIAQTRLNAAGLQGLSGLRVLEVEMRQSKAAGFNQVPINPAAAMLLEPFRFRTFM